MCFRSSFRTRGWNAHLFQPQVIGMSPIRSRATIALQSLPTPIFSCSTSVPCTQFIRVVSDAERTADQRLRTLKTGDCGVITKTHTASSHQACCLYRARVQGLRALLMRVSKYCPKFHEGFFRLSVLRLRPMWPLIPSCDISILLNLGTHSDDLSVQLCPRLNPPSVHDAKRNQWSYGPGTMASDCIHASFSKPKARPLALFQSS